MSCHYTSTSRSYVWDFSIIKRNKTKTSLRFSATSYLHFVYHWLYDVLFCFLNMVLFDSGFIFYFKIVYFPLVHREF
jgi:hypothetical protein